MKIKRKQIAFNLDDPLQKELYEHTEKYKNFSFYGKSLIQKDMQKDIEISGIEKGGSKQVSIGIEIAKGFI